MKDQDGFGLEEAVEGFNVSRETKMALATIIEELHDWRLRINLIGPSEAGQVWRRHVYDSLQLAAHIDLSKRTLDLGSGAGFPGLILAALAKEKGGDVTMIESVGKKCAFLRHVAAQATLPVKVLNQRVENSEGVSADFITARAFAPLPKLLAYAERWLDSGAIGIFPKGRRWQEELTQASDYWTFSHEVIPSQSGDGVILKIWEVARGA